LERSGSQSRQPLHISLRQRVIHPRRGHIHNGRTHLPPSRHNIHPKQRHVIDRAGKHHTVEHIQTVPHLRQLQMQFAKVGALVAHILDMHPFPFQMALHITQIRWERVRLQRQMRRPPLANHRCQLGNQQMLSHNTSPLSLLSRITSQFSGLSKAWV